VRGAIEREAQRSGRSLSAQAEAILLEAALEKSRTERKSRALGYLITQAAKVMEAAGRNEGVGFDWQTSRFDFEVEDRDRAPAGPNWTAARARKVTVRGISDAGRSRPDCRRNHAGNRDPRQGAGA
jgi:hypothetical protein